MGKRVENTKKWLHKTKSLSRSQLFRLLAANLIPFYGNVLVIIMISKWIKEAK